MNQSALRSKVALAIRESNSHKQASWHRTVQDLLGHADADVKITQRYTHALNKGGLAVISSVDELH